MRNDLSLDIIEADLRLENGDATVDVEDLHDEGRLVIIHLKLQLRVTVCWAEAFSWARLTMLIALIADNVRVVDTVKVLGSDHADVKVAHWSLNIVTMNLFGTIKLTVVEKCSSCVSNVFDVVQIWTCSPVYEVKVQIFMKELTEIIQVVSIAVFSKAKPIGALCWQG